MAGAIEVILPDLCSAPDLVLCPRSASLCVINCFSLIAPETGEGNDGRQQGVSAIGQA